MMNIPKSALLANNEVPNPIPDGMKVVSCSRCEAKFLVPVDAPYTADSICEICATMPQSAGSQDAASAVAAALGK